MKYLFFLLIIIFFGCRNESKKIIGRWKADNSELRLTIYSDSLDWKVGQNKPLKLHYKYENSFLFVDNFGKIDTLKISRCKNDSLLLILKEKGIKKEKLFLKDKQR